MHAVVDRQVLEDGEVELVVHQRVGHVAREAGVAFQGRNGARSQALVRDRVLDAHAQRESRVVIEEKRGRVIVVEEHEHVGLLLIEPGFDRLIASEERSPVGVVLLVAVVGAADGGDVRGADAAEDFCHGGNSWGMMGPAK